MGIVGAPGATPELVDRQVDEYTQDMLERFGFQERTISPEQEDAIQQLKEQDPVDQNLEKIGENLRLLEGDLSEAEANRLLAENERMLEQNDRLIMEGDYKLMFEEGVLAAGSYEAFVEDMQQKAASDLAAGHITQAAHDKRLEVVEQSGNDPDKFAKLAADADSFMVQEAQKIQKDQNNFSQMLNADSFMNDLQNGNFMGAIIGLLTAFMSGEQSLDGMLGQLKQELQNANPATPANEQPAQTAKTQDVDTPASEVAEEKPVTEEPVQTAEAPENSGGVGGVNGNAVNYVMLDGPPAAGEPVVDFDGGQSTTLNSLFGSMATLDGASYMQTDAKVEPEIQVPLRAPDDAPTLAQNEDVLVQQMAL